MSDMNGLDQTQEAAIIDLKYQIAELQHKITRVFPPHRSISTAVTKLDEACHWLEDRKNRPALKIG